MKTDERLGALRNLWVENMGHGVLEETAKDFAPLRDGPSETSWFLYGSEGLKQSATVTTGWAAINLQGKPGNEGSG